MFVTVGQRFNKFRGVACGLLATGAGFGLLAGKERLCTKRSRALYFPLVSHRFVRIF